MPVAFDVTVVSTLTRKCLSKAQRVQPVPIGAAALEAEQSKLRRHANLAVEFIPLAVDAFGGWTPVTLRILWNTPDDGWRGQ